MLTERMRKSLARPGGMQRRHFELIADCLSTARPPDGALGDERCQWVHAVEVFASRLNDTNSRFNRDRFLRACGVEP